MEVTADIRTPSMKNFTEIFKALSNIGLHSLERLDRRLPFYVPNENDGYLVHYEKMDLELLDNIKAYRVLPKGSPRDVVACDTSILKLAEGPYGFLAALRGSIVRRSRGHIDVWVIGPAVFFVPIDDGLLIASAISELMNLKLDCSGYDNIHKSMGSLMEKLLQRSIAATFRDSMLLFDGSLTAGPAIDSLQLIRETLKIAEKNNNIVFAFSKTTRLSLFGERITALALGAKPPCVIDVDDALSLNLKLHKVGRILVSYLSDIYFPYRLDVSSYDMEDALEWLGSLLVSDALVYGYPETLAIAHNFCTFNKIDILGLQRMLRQQFNILTFEELDVRNVIFSPLDGASR